MVNGVQWKSLEYVHQYLAVKVVECAEANFCRLFTFIFLEVILMRTIVCNLIILVEPTVACNFAGAVYVC
jgi:hypothetical protein